MGDRWVARWETGLLADGCNGGLYPQPLAEYRRPVVASVVTVRDPKLSQLVTATDIIVVQYEESSPRFAALEVNPSLPC